MKYKLLIVDDETANLRLLERLFSDEYQCLTASSGPEALRLLEQHDVAILITDQRMPEMTGIDLLKRSAKLRPHMVRILLTGYTDVEALVEAINCGLVYIYVTKPWNNDDLKLKISRACEYYESTKNRNSLTSANNRLLQELKETKMAVVNGLGDMLRSRNQGQYDHAIRVRGYAAAIAERMNLGLDEIEDLSAAALLHSLERTDSFGNRSTATRRTDDHSATAREHSDCEAKLLASIPSAGNMNDIIKFYRENFDGTGPGRMKSEQIPQASRVLRVADEYDSLIQPESSLARLMHDEAMQFLLQRSGKQFDPQVIEIMSQLNPDEISTPETLAVAGENSRVVHEPLEPAFVDAIVW
jgi:response regulator RpfG family c-di-GMP phosphodiesterase